MDDQPVASDEFMLGPVLIFMALLMFTFLTRGLFSPLLPLIEEEFGINHAKASRLFLILQIGFSGTMVFSGYISKLLRHRGAILLYEALIGVSLVACALSRSFVVFRISVFFIGVGAGLYAPSGVASLTTLVHQRQWGKAIGIHELGPGLGMVLAPIIVGFLSPIIPWRYILVIVACCNWMNGLIFLFFGRGGRFRGEPPHFANVKTIVNNGSFWILVVFFILGASASMGVYSILPTFLISDKGMEPRLVNTLVGLSRSTGLIVVFMSGYLADKFGIKALLITVFLISGTLVLLIGVLDELSLLIAVFFQPMIIGAFFPVASTAISLITPPKTRNVAFSIVIPLAGSVGAGITPSLIGWLGEMGRFETGFIIIGLLILISLSLVFFLRITPPAEAARRDDV